MAGLTEAVPGSDGWRSAGPHAARPPASSRRLGLPEIMRRDIAERLVAARRAMPKDVSPQNRRGLIHTFAATAAHRSAEIYKRRKVLAPKSQDRWQATADYWELVADNIIRLR